MSLKGKAAIVGMGELRPMKTPPKRTGMGLIAEAASRAIQDAGLTKADIDGVMGEPPDGDVGDGGAGTDQIFKPGHSHERVACRSAVI